MSSWNPIGRQLNARLGASLGEGIAHTACTRDLTTLATWQVVLFVALHGVAHAQGEPSASRLELDAQRAARAGQFEIAAKDYEELIRRVPRSAELWSNLGAMRALGGDCGRALEALGRSRSLNARLFGPWYFSGFCHLGRHQNQEALAEFGRALEINPRDANAWFLKAQAESNLDRLGASFRAVVESLALDPNRPEGHYLAGKTALGLAARCYARVQAQAKSSPYSYRLEGERDAAQGLFDTAIANYQRAAGLAPQDAGILFALGTAYLEGARFADAEAALRKCLQVYPRSRWAKARLALVLAEEKKGSEAERLLSSLRPEELECAEEFQDALVCAYRLKATQAGERLLGPALERFPENAKLSQWRSRLASMISPGQGNEGPSPVELRNLTGTGFSARFVTLSTADLANLFASAGAYRNFRRAFLREEILSAGRVVAQNLSRLPADARGAFFLGEILQWLAFRFYERLGTTFPDSDAAQRLAAENFSAAGQQDRALEIYKTLLEKSGESPELLRDIARIYWTQHRWDQALKILESLIQADPYDSSALVNVGRIYSYQQDLEQARRFFERAREIDPEMFEAHLGLGETKRRMGDNQGALTELKIASELDPKNPRPHYALSQIYRGMDRKDLADQEMTTFQRLQARASAGTARRPGEFVPLE